MFFVDLKDVPPDRRGELLFVDSEVLEQAVQAATDTFSSVSRKPLLQ